MKFIVIVVGILASINGFAQNGIIDINEILGKNKYSWSVYSDMYFTKDGDVLLDVVDEIVRINRDGDIMSRVKNPLKGHKIKYEPNEQKYYDREQDVFVILHQKKYYFIRNFSTNNPQLVVLDGLAEWSLRYAKCVFLDNSNYCIIKFEANYDSKTDNKTDASKYKAMLKIINVDLDSKQITEKNELIEWDKEIQLQENESFNFQILDFNKDNIRLAISRINVQVVHPVIEGKLYSGTTSLFDYNMNTKKLGALVSFDYCTTSEAVFSSLSFDNNGGVSLSWTEQIKGSKNYSLHGKSYVVSDTWDVDTVIYDFPEDIVALIKPEVTNDVFEYTNLDGQNFYVLSGRFVKSRRGRDPIPAYVMVAADGHVDILERHEYCTEYYFRKSSYERVLELENKYADQITTLLNPIMVKGVNSSIFNEDYRVLTVNDKLVLVKSVLEYKGMSRNDRPSTFLIQMIDLE